MSKNYSKHFLPWVNQAECAKDPSSTRWAYADSDDPEALDDEYAEAFINKFCMSCPVMMQCMEHALNQPEPQGVWGGLTAKERAERLGQ